MQHIEHDLLGVRLSDLVAVHDDPVVEERRTRDRWVVTNVVTVLLIGLLSSVYFIDLEAFLIEVNSTWLDVIVGLVPSEYWLPNVQAFVTSLLIFLLISSLFVRLRLRLVSRHCWSSTCPTCGEIELTRVHRTTTQRLAGILMQLPLHHYYCKDCEWHGVRTNRDHL